MSGRQLTERFQLLFSKEELRKLDEWRWENRVEGRAEAIRRLIQLGLEKEREDKTKARRQP